MSNPSFWCPLANSSISALEETESALIKPVAGVVLAEEPGMRRRNDDQLQATHCLLQCQMSPMKLVAQLFPNNKSVVVSNHWPEPFLDNMIGLVSPFAGIHNLDLSPDSLSIVDGSHQIWGQLTPHDDSSFDSVPVHDVGSSATRAYQSEAEMLVQKRLIQSMIDC